MRVDARRLPGFLRDPGTCRLVLLYGDDVGLIRARSDALTTAVVGRSDDPFRVTDVTSVSALSAEAETLSLGGGRRVVRLRDAGDAATDAASTLLSNGGSGFVIIEAPGLTARSKLRSRVEDSPLGAAIGCYAAEGAALERIIQDTVDELGATIEAEARRYAASRLGGEYAEARQEAEKLALYAGLGGIIDLTVARDCLAEAGDLALDDAVLSATEGDSDAVDKALEAALRAGQTATSATRAMMSHLQRLLRARLVWDREGDIEEALAGLRPPVFWRHQARFKRALSLWTAGDLRDELEAVRDAERRSRQTGAPVDAVCLAATFHVARRAVALRQKHRFTRG